MRKSNALVRAINQEINTVRSPYFVIINSSNGASAQQDL